MFDRGASGSTNFAHGFSGVITIFCRCILATLEDNVITASQNSQQLQQQSSNGDVPFLFSSPSSLSSSPASFSVSPHFVQQPLHFNSPSSSSSPSSRKTTLNSLGGTTNMPVYSSSTVNSNFYANQALWSFVLYVFNEYAQIVVVDERSESTSAAEKLKTAAQKNFKAVYVEITGLNRSSSDATRLG